MAQDTSAVTPRTRLIVFANVEPLRADEKEKPAPLKLKVGDMAPDFTLRYFDGAKVQDITLHEFRGKKNVIVAFFVFAFTGG